MSKRYHYLHPKNQWGWMKHKYKQMLFYKDFEIVFGMRQSRDRHKAYLLRSQKVCQECGTDTQLTIDHIIPLRMFGADRLWNKQLLCLPCNKDKSGIPYSLNMVRARQLKVKLPVHEPLPLEIWPLVASIGKLSTRKWKKWRKKRNADYVKGTIVAHPRQSARARKRRMSSLRDPNRAYQLRQRLTDGDNLP